MHHAAAADGTTLTLPSDEEILITRAFAAPPRLVFRALTEPDLIARWWAPRSIGSMVSATVDLRVGGRWRLLMRTHDGHEVGFSGEYLEIAAPTRLVNTEVFDPFPDAGAVVTVELQAVGAGGADAGNTAGTVMTSRSRYPSREVRDTVIATGMEHGMRESMLQLTAVVAELA